MTIHINYTQARANLAKLLDEATDNQEVVIIKRRGKENAALIAADELESLLETAHLMRSPANAERLIAALGRALQGETNTISLEQLRAEVGVDAQEA